MLVAELRQQHVDLGAMMGLVIEEMRQDHSPGILDTEPGIVHVSDAAVLEIRGQFGKEVLDAPIQARARVPQRTKVVEQDRIEPGRGMCAPFDIQIMSPRSR